MMEVIISLMFSGVVLLWLIGWAIHLSHFHYKFKQCSAGFTAAAKSNNRAEQWVYLRASRLAHEDTIMAPLWPLVVNRWNVDYVAEARASQ